MVSKKILWNKMNRKNKMKNRQDLKSCLKRDSLLPLRNLNSNFIELQTISRGRLSTIKIPNLGGLEIRATKSISYKQWPANTKVKREITGRIAKKRHQPDNTLQNMNNWFENTGGVEQITITLATQVEQLASRTPHPRQSQFQEATTI